MNWLWLLFAFAPGWLLELLLAVIEVHPPVFDDAAPWRNQYQEREPEMFHEYRRKQIAELRPYVSGEDMTGISVSDADKAAGSPKQGDMIARNPKNHDDKWLVAAQYFADNFESVA